MKRTKPLKRTAFRKKALAGTSAVKRRNANLRRMSAKKRKERRTVGPVQKEWLSQWLKCWHCRKRKPLTIQHISKQSKGGDCHHLCNLYASCQECNCGPLDHSDKNCLAMQLAHKFFYDSVNYDLAKWREIHGPSPNRPNEEDVKAARWKYIDDGFASEYGQ